jgi:membrane dipeptidase
MKFLGALAFAAFASTFISSAFAAEPDVSIMVVDLHADVPWQVRDRGRSPKLFEGQLRIEAIKAGQYGGIVLPIYISDKIKGGPKISDAEAIYDAARSVVDASAIFLPLGSRAALPERISTFLAIEGAGAFADDPPAIDRFIDRGVRLVGLAHTRNNRFASAAMGKREKFGLTDLGKEFAKRIYEKGALVDVSHLSDLGFTDLVPIADSFGAPIVATHSNARALCNVPRNLTDDQLRHIGRTGGVAGLNFHASFVCSTSTKPTMIDVIKQLEYMVKLAGMDHVAIGSDFDGDIDPAEGLEDASRLPELAAELRRRKWMNDDILKVFSLNALRVLSYRPRKVTTAITSP